MIFTDRHIILVVDGISSNRVPCGASEQDGFYGFGATHDFGDPSIPTTSTLAFYFSDQVEEKRPREKGYEHNRSSQGKFCVAHLSDRGDNLRFRAVRLAGANWSPHLLAIG